MLLSSTVLYMYTSKTSFFNGNVASDAKKTVSDAGTKRSTVGPVNHTKLRDTLSVGFVRSTEYVL
jgi:hypothetical protein